MSSAARCSIRAATSESDLRGILALQAANLSDAITADELASQGFVTLRHDLALLREMNTPHAHIIATPHASNEVIAYALVMRHEFRDRFPVLEPMYRQLEGRTVRGRPIESFRSYFMGQLCVAKPHRGRGVVERLYAGHREQMAPHFDLMITVIDRANPRSVRVHERCGCEPLHEYRTEDGREWVIVLLDLSRA